MKSVQEIPFARPMIGAEEKEAVLRVLDGHILTHGPECKRFEEEFCRMAGGSAQCLSVSSCMAALHLCALALRVGPGDEVVVPALTHVATVHAVEWVGARPVFVDCVPETGNISLPMLAKAVTPRTKAIFLVHFAGIPCDMDGVMAIAARHNLHVIEDCALALGARWRGEHVGTIGTAGCFSFYPVKHITTAEGGMFLSKHDGFFETVSRMRAFGVDRTHGERNLPGQYDVPWLGLNYRMSEIQAAIGVVQLNRTADFQRRREANFRAWSEALADLKNVSLLRDQSNGVALPSPYCAVVRLDGTLRARRNEIILELKRRGIGTSVYYPQPVPRMSYYRAKYGYDAALFPNAEAIADGSIAFPVGPHLSEADVAEMAERFREVL